MSLQGLMAEGLPLNRKEKYYTGTVFPGIVCADNFRNFNAFAALLPGSPAFTIEPNPSRCNIQFFTEYSPLHSFIGAAKARMLEQPSTNETPDVAIVINGETERTLIVLEAKVFDHTSEAKLSEQLRKQEPFINCVRASIGVSQVFHAALIPEGLRREYRRFDYPVVTWDRIRDAYSGISPDNYFLGVLEVALESFEELRGTGQQSRGLNADDMLTGAEIVRQYAAGTLEFSSMGRNRGLDGPELANDFSSGGWRTRRYEVRRDGTPRPNWFDISEFVRRAESGTQQQQVTRVFSKSKLTGSEILRQHGNGSLWYKTVGRNRGLNGPEFAADLASGRWSSHNYEVSTNPVPENRNWFTVDEFAACVSSGRR